MKKRGDNKKAQVTIFVILAILIITGVVVYFLIKSPFQREVPKEFKPVYDYYLTCLEETTKQGALLLGSQAGYIEKPAFVPGSQYMPFSSQLDFLGQGVPYWIYVSGNNILKEQVPRKSEMETQLENYIQERVNDCDFSEFIQKGYDTTISEEPKVDVTIKDLKVDVSIKNSIGFYFENDSAVLNQETFSIDSKLGKFYSLALDVYNYEKTNVFLEKYALDVMRLYAPVDGSDIGCKPKIFIDEQIKQNLSLALAENIAALKLDGSYYTLTDAEKKYFVTDIGQVVDENVNFLYTTDMPTRIDIYGDKVVQPVGLQEGMGILGFCYTPYHLIYDINFPVLIQFYDGNELFQFPMAVIIERNKERQGFDGEAGIEIGADVCRYKNQKVSIYTFDSELNPLEASLKFKCLNTECVLGDSKLNEANEAVFEGLVPQCVNGFIIANAEGYADSKYQISTNEENSANVVLSKIYSLPLDLGSEISNAVVTFDSEDYSTTVAYPDTKNVELIEGYYNISVYAYTNSSLRLPATSQRKCVDVPKSSIMGMFGATQEKCFNVDIPAQTIDYALSGGGKTSDYITENQLRTGKKMNIQVQLFNSPMSLEKLQQNYLELEDAVIYLEII